MFSSSLDRTKTPLTLRRSGIAMGSVILVGVAAALVSAKTTPFSFAAILCVALAVTADGQWLARLLPHGGPVTRDVALFLLYALASASWAVDPSLSLQSVGLGAIVALGTLILGQVFTQEARHNLLHLGEGLWIGFAVGLGYLFVEVVFDQSLKIWLYNAIGVQPADLKHPSYFAWSGGKLVSISPDDLKHSIAPVPLFLWPAVLAVRGTLARQWRGYAAALLAILSGSVVLLSTHGTSKLAYVAGLISFCAALGAPRFIGKLIAIGWVTICLAVVPAALVAHRIGLHNAAWLAPSARHRVIIWNFTAEQFLKAPLLGVGADTTYVLGPRMEAGIVNAPDEAYERTLSRHSHDIYLQTWFELGLVGATLLTLAGLAILASISSLPADFQPYAYATFVSAAVMASASYGMWQIWFLAMYGLCAALFGLSRNLMGNNVASSEGANQR